MDAPIRPGTVFEFEGFRLHKLTRQLLRTDAGRPPAPVVLGSRAIDTLLSLAERSGEVVSKQALMSAVWPGTRVEENNLAVQISALRRVLDAGRSGPSLIQTVPGRGYLLGADAIRAPPSPREPLCAGAMAADAAPEGAWLAVMPFEVVGGDGEQEYLADAVVDEVITALARLPWMSVIARNSTFIYKGRKTDSREIGRELGVRYVLEGALRRSGAQVRLFAELIEAQTGRHIWARRFDGDVGDLFALQDELAAGAAGAIEPALAAAEQARAARKPPETLDALESCLRGMWHFHKTTPADYELARAFLRRAVALDPGLAAAHSGLALVTLYDAYIFQPELRPELVPAGAEHARRALALDPFQASARATLACALLMLGRHAESLVEAEAALRLGPNFAWAHATLGTVLVLSGRHAEGIIALRRAMRLSPFDPWTWFWQLEMTQAHYFGRDYPAAAGAARELLRLRPGLRVGWALLIAALGQEGGADAARGPLAEAEAHGVDLRQGAALDCIKELREQDGAHLVEGWTKAGLRRSQDFS